MPEPISFQSPSVNKWAKTALAKDDRDVSQTDRINLIAAVNQDGISIEEIQDLETILFSGKYTIKDKDKAEIKTVLSAQVGKNYQKASKSSAQSAPHSKKPPANVAVECGEGRAYAVFPLDTEDRYTPIAIISGDGQTILDLKTDSGMIDMDTYFNRLGLKKIDQSSWFYSKTGKVQVPATEAYRQVMVAMLFDYSGKQLSDDQKLKFRVLFANEGIIPLNRGGCNLDFCQVYNLKTGKIEGYNPSQALASALFF